MKILIWKKYTHIIIVIFLSLISLQTISIYSLFPNVPLRMELQQSIFDGTIEPPYQYRILLTTLAYGIQKTINFILPDKSVSHILSYQFLSFFIFIGIFYLFYNYLKIFFTESWCIIGIILLYLVMPLGITGIWGEEEDYLTLLFFLIGLNLIFTSKEKFLPLLVAVGVFNREQTIFIVIFYICYAAANKKLFSVQTIVIVILSVIFCAGGIYLLKIIYGFKETKYTFEWNVSENIRELRKIFSLWSVMVLPFVIMCILSYKKSSAFFRYSFIAVGIYVTAFFFNGFLTQLTKFLPAYLVLIPMSLQFLSKEFTGDYYSKHLTAAGYDE